MRSHEQPWYRWSVLSAVLLGLVCIVGSDAEEGGRTDKDDQAEKDWPMWGGTPDRNMVSKTKGITLDFQAKTADHPDEKNILWSAKLGSQAYGNPVVANGKIFVGTNNHAEYRPKHKGDRGCLIAFDEKTGAFLWQLTREKLPTGRVNDWPLQGICSVPIIEGNRMWIVTSRCELMCLDTEGFLDGKNDGAVQDEADKEKQDADIVWNLDMIEDLGVFPHNLATSSPTIHGDFVYLVTSNGVDEAHLNTPSPRAPCFLAVNKNTGKVEWEDNSPFDKILHGQWSSPAIGVVNGKAQVYMPGGDGILYAFDAITGKRIWSFDLNPKDSKWELGGRGTRNNIIATPVFHENSIVVGVGQDPEHGEGVGHLYRIDATKSGDVTESGKIWHHGGESKDHGLVFRRTLSTAAIHNGLVYAADLSGFLHCLDFKTGKRYWEHDMESAIWGSPFVVDGKVWIGDEDGRLHIFAEGQKLQLVKTIQFNSSLYTTPVVANGVLYITDRSRIYAIKNR